MGEVNLTGQSGVRKRFETLADITLGTLKTQTAYAIPPLDISKYREIWITCKNLTSGEQSTASFGLIIKFENSADKECFSISFNSSGYGAASSGEGLRIIKPVGGAYISEAVCVYYEYGKLKSNEYFYGLAFSRNEIIKQIKCECNTGNGFQAGAHILIEGERR